MTDTVDPVPPLMRPFYADHMDEVTTEDTCDICDDRPAQYRLHFTSGDSLMAVVSDISPLSLVESALCPIYYCSCVPHLKALFDIPFTYVVYGCCSCLLGVAYKYKVENLPNDNHGNPWLKLTRQAIQ